MPRIRQSCQRARAVLIATVLFGFVTSSTTANAQLLGRKKGRSEWSIRPLSLDVIAGLGTPVGYIGGGVDVAPVNWLSVGAGMGESTGLQIAVWGGVRLVGNEHQALGLRAVFSTGPFEGAPWPNLGENDYWRKVRRAYWLSPEVGYELRTSGGFDFRVFGGGAVLLNPSDATCERNGALIDCADPLSGGRPNVVPYVGIALGYAFKL